MDKAFETGLRFDFNIVHNFEQIKKKLREKERKEKNKNSIELPQILGKSMNITTTDKYQNPFNSQEMEFKNELTYQNIKENTSTINEISNFNPKNMTQSQDFHKDFSTDQNVIQNFNESKNVSVVGENESYYKTSRKEFFSPNKKNSIKNKRESDEIKLILEKDILGKSTNAYNRLKSEAILRNFNKKKSSNQMLNELTQGGDNDETNSINKSQYGRFFKMKQILRPQGENLEEDYKQHENEGQDNDYETNFLDSGLKKPKRKIQIAIFTQKNKSNEETKDIEQFIKKLELNQEENDDNLKKTIKESQEIKNKSSEKRDDLKTSPLKHPLTFSDYNKYGLYSGFKKQQLKVEYGLKVVKRNNFQRNRIMDINNSRNLEEKKSINSSPKSLKNKKEKKQNKQKLPKIKEKLQTIYKEDPDIIKSIRNLKHVTNLSLEDYQLKLIDVAKKILDDDNMKNLVNRFKDITDVSELKDKVKYHRSINRWEIMVKAISRFIPEFLVEKLKSQK